MGNLNEVEVFFNEFNPADVRRDLADLFDDYMLNEHEQGNFNFENISRKNYVVRRIGELIDFLSNQKLN